MTTSLRNILVPFGICLLSMAPCPPMKAHADNVPADPRDLAVTLTRSQIAAAVAALVAQDYDAAVPKPGTSIAVTAGSRREGARDGGRARNGNGIHGVSGAGSAARLKRIQSPFTIRGEA